MLCQSQNTTRCRNSHSVSCSAGAGARASSSIGCVELATLTPVAVDPYVAEDAADLIDITIDPLPVLLDADAPPGEFSAGRSTEAALPV